MSERISLFGVPVDAETPTAILARMIQRAQQKVPTRVYYVNAHVLNLAHDDPEFRKTLASGDIVLADGYGARFAARLLGLREPERMAITDYIWDFARLCAETHTTLFIVAGRPGVAERAQAELERRFPALEIVGVHHGYLADEAASTGAIQQILKAKPGALCVGMGSPNQERWIEANSEALQVPLVFAVGAVMDFVSGEVERPRPTWMSDRGLEWTGRLAAEPRRMWRRYLVGNPRFVLRTLAVRSGRAPRI